MSMWTQRQAIDLCIQIEQFAPNYGCHVALTGGCLYKFGLRKDVDIMIYRIRQVDKIDVDGLTNHMKRDLGVKVVSEHGWVTKLETHDGKGIDLFDSSVKEDGTYPVEVQQIEVTAIGFDVDSLGNKWHSTLTAFD